MLSIVNTGYFQTPIGVLVHQWTKVGLAKVELFADPSAPAIAVMSQFQQVHESNDLRDFELLVGQYFQGHLVSFDNIRVDDSDWSDFFARVYQECRKIQLGETLSYRELASRAGRPAAARAVGQAMARNRIPIVIPCHRVVGSTGRLTGFSAPGGIETKRWLLQHESDLTSLVENGARTKYRKLRPMSLAW